MKFNLFKSLAVLAASFLCVGAHTPAKAMAVFERSYELSGYGSYTLPFFDPEWGSLYSWLVLEERFERSVTATLTNPFSEPVYGMVIVNAGSSMVVLKNQGGGGATPQLVQEGWFAPGDTLISGTARAGVISGMGVSWVDPRNLDIQFEEAFAGLGSYYAALGMSDPDAGTFTTIELSNVSYGTPSARLTARVWYEPSGVPIPAASAVPEPSAWILLLAGFAFTGATMRRRRQQQRLVNCLRR